MLRICFACGALYNAQRKRTPSYCSTACRVRSHRQRQANGGWPLPGNVDQVDKNPSPGTEGEGTTNNTAQIGADKLATAISGAIFAAESLDLGTLDRDDVDQENAVTELRRTLRALHQAADAAAGVVVATGGP